MIVDVTSKDEFEMSKRAGNLPSGHVLHIPMDEASLKVPSIASDKTTPLVFYCMHGVRSGMVARFAREQGFINAYALADAKAVKEGLKMAGRADEGGRRE